METKYDIISDFLLDNWVIAAIVIICAILGVIPQVREGALLLWNWGKRIFQKSDKYQIKFPKETVTAQRIFSCEHLDIIKIEAVSHAYGIRSEYAWKKKYYPAYDCPGQSLRFFQTEQGERVFDVLHITNGQVKKDLYFDITIFYYGPIGEYGDKDKYVVQKINELYKKNE